MPCEIVWEHKGVYKHLSGFVSAAEFVRSVETVQADPRFDEIRYVINDFSDVTAHQLTEDLLSELVAIQYGAQASNPNCKVVYVGADQDLSRLLETLLVGSQASVYQVMLFATVPEAREWLQCQMRMSWSGRFPGQHFTHGSGR